MNKEARMALKRLSRKLSTTKGIIIKLSFAPRSFKSWNSWLYLNIITLRDRRKEIKIIANKKIKEPIKIFLNISFI